VRYFNHCCSGEAISIAYSMCVFVALSIQDAKGIRVIPICGLSGSTIFFSLYFIKKYDFRKKIEHKMRIFIFSTNFFSKMFHILRTNGRGVIKMYIGLYYSAVYSCHILIQLRFSRQIFKNVFKYQI